MLAGARIALYNADKTIKIEELITNASGQVDFAASGKLEAGETYYYKEIQAPVGYIIADSDFKEIKVDYNGNVTFTNGKALYNDKIIAEGGTESTKITKYRTGTNEALPGAVIALYKADKTTKIDEQITDENGQVDLVLSGKLEAGETYYYKEIRSSSGISNRK